MIVSNYVHRGLQSKEDIEIDFSFKISERKAQPKHLGYFAGVSPQKFSLQGLLSLLVDWMSLPTNIDLQNTVFWGGSAEQSLKIDHQSTINNAMYELAKSAHIQTREMMLAKDFLTK